MDVNSVFYRYAVGSIRLPELNVLCPYWPSVIAGHGAGGTNMAMGDTELDSEPRADSRTIGRPGGRPGRPRTVTEKQRRVLLIDAAESVFLERGYHASTMDDVAQQAGMSKKTVYQVFSGKAVLFEALLIERLAILTMPFEEDGLPLADSLIELLMRLANFVLSPKQMALIRLMVAEGPRSPEIVEALKRLEIGRGRGPLERWFARKAEQGLITVDDPRETASIVFGMVLGEIWCSTLLNTEPRPTDAEIRLRARRCVGMVLPRSDSGPVEQ
jgi:TetR/AcrR family transcriptional regulator of autoinduction and epiphytic fitness